MTTENNPAGNEAHNETSEPTAEPIIMTAQAPQATEAKNEPTVASTSEHKQNSGSSDNSKDKDDDEASNNKLMAVLSYLGVLVLVPLLVAKDKPFVKFHIKQGLILIVGWGLVWVISMIAIPFYFLAPLLWFALFVLDLIGVLNAVSGKQKPVPVVGQYAKIFDDLLA